MLLPHELFASLYHDYPQAFEKNILPGFPDESQKLETFWQSVHNHPSLQQHPLKTRPEYWQKAVPLGIHGDDVPITGMGKTWVTKITQWSGFRV